GGEVNFHIDAGLTLADPGTGAGGNDGKIRISDFQSTQLLNILQPQLAYSGDARLPLDTDALSFLPDTFPPLEVVLHLENDRNKIVGSTPILEDYEKKFGQNGFEMTITAYTSPTKKYDIPLKFLQSDLDDNETLDDLANDFNRKILAYVKSK